MTQLTRRSTLGLLGALGAFANLPVTFAQGVESRKFIFIVLRGAMDGLSALIPDDPELEGLRPSLLADQKIRLNLGNGFRLHPALSLLKTEYDLGHAAFIHAASTPYRKRSHFDGQDALESLGKKGAKDGWLNRALQVNGGSGLAVGHTVPLALRGTAPISNWSPPVFAQASEDLLDRLSDLYTDSPAFATSLAQARETMTRSIAGQKGKNFSRTYTAALQAAGRLMAVNGGPGVGMVELGGWDTHSRQKQRLKTNFTQLNDGLSHLKSELGNQWQNTCVVICSEFGRTAAANGTAGSDHGTGGLVTLLGGAVKGGQVYGDWPGLSNKALYQARDLAPANEISAILKGILRDHLGLDRRALDTRVLPNSGRGWDGLIRT